MSLTPVGLIFVGICAALLIFGRQYLMVLLVVGASLHSPAVLTLDSFGSSSTIGVSPWLFAAFACLLHVFISWRRFVDLGLLRSLNFASGLGWVPFLLFSVCTALLSPHLHSGVLVYELGNRLGFDTSPVPLRWTMSNAVQSVNALVVAFVFGYCAVMARTSNAVALVRYGLIAAVALSVTLSLYQRLQLIELAPTFDWFMQSYNPSYTHREGRYFVVTRLHWPFSEPSYASVWFASLYVGGLSLLLLTRRVWLGFVCVLLCGASLANTVGASGIVAAAAGTLLLFILFAYRASKVGIAGDADIRSRFAALVVLGGLSVASCLALSTVSKGEVTPASVLGRLLDQRIERIEAASDTRSRSNIRAISIVRETWLTGVGLGSNRASSYLASLASNLGLPLFVLFILLLFAQVRSLWRAASSCATATFILFGMITAFVGVSLAIPDLNWPGWWIWPILGLVLCTRLGLSEHDPRREASTGS